MIYKKNIFFSNLREKGFEETKIRGIVYFMGIDLRERGIDIDEDITTVAEAREAILRLYRQ